MVFVNLMKLNIEFYADRTFSLPYLLVIYRLCKNKISDMPISGKKVSAKSWCTVGKPKSCNVIKRAQMSLSHVKLWSVVFSKQKSVNTCFLYLNNGRGMFYIIQ